MLIKEGAKRSKVTRCAAENHSSERGNVFTGQIVMEPSDHMDDRLEVIVERDEKW